MNAIGPTKPQEQEDDEELVQAAKADPAAFEGLYHRYVTRVYRYLYARVNSRDEAADLTQQVFLKALDALPNYRSKGGAFAAWLFRIAYHVVADTYRRHKVTLSWEALPDLEYQGMRPHHKSVYVCGQSKLAKNASIPCKLLGD